MTSIDPKVAAGAVGTFLATLVVGLLNRYTSYQPTVEETGAIVGLFGFACGWLIPRFIGDLNIRFIGEDETPAANEELI